MPALREAVLNAVVHKDYAIGAPIQISVYPDKLLIWNPGELPPNWTVDKLLIQQALGLRHEDHFRAKYLIPALQSGFVEMTVPNRP